MLHRLRKHLVQFFKPRPTLTREQLRQARLMVWVGAAGLKPEPGQPKIIVECERAHRSS